MANRCLSANVSHNCDLRRVFCIPPSCIYTWTQLICESLDSKHSRKCVSGEVFSNKRVTQSEWWEDSLEAVLPRVLITICSSSNIGLSAETNRARALRLLDHSELRGALGKRAESKCALMDSKRKISLGEHVMPFKNTKVLLCYFVEKAIGWLFRAEVCQQSSEFSCAYIIYNWWWWKLLLTSQVPAFSHGDRPKRSAETKV